MTTDKDRKEINSFVDKWISGRAQAINIFTTEELKEHDDAVTEQARKEAVDSETLSDIRRICEIILGNNFGNRELDSLAFYVGHHPAILNSTARKKKTDSEKLAIAVKALKNIIDGNDLACERGESMASWMDSDFRRQAKDALKEIQG